MGLRTLLRRHPAPPPPAVAAPPDPAAAILAAVTRGLPLGEYETREYGLLEGERAALLAMIRRAIDAGWNVDWLTTLLSGWDRDATVPPYDLIRDRLHILAPGVPIVCPGDVDHAWTAALGARPGPCPHCQPTARGGHG